jgi:hypothetical protein
MSVIKIECWYSDNVYIFKSVLLHEMQVVAHAMFSKFSLTFFGTALHYTHKMSMRLTNEGFMYKFPV